MEDNGKITSEMTAQGGDVDKKYSYVLHGGLAYCPFGTRPSRLRVPLDHGTNIHDMPIMTVQDCAAKVNVQPFGICTCPSNPDKLAKMDEIKEEVEDSGGFLDKVMDFFCGSSDAKDEDYTKDLKDNVIVVCDPEFAINDEWEEGTENLRIKGVKALNSGCTLYCLKGAAESDPQSTIHIIDDGQENAEKEKQNLCDFSQWKEGDPAPEPSQSNLANLGKDISNMQEQIDHCQDPNGRQQLQSQMDAKIKLQSNMKETNGMLDQINQQGLGADDARKEQLNNAKSKVRESYNNGQALDKDEFQKLVTPPEASSEGGSSD